MTKLWCLLVLMISFACAAQQRRIAITLDDPHTASQPLFDWRERNDRILAALKKHSLNTALFVCGKRIDSADGQELLAAWDKQGHLLANHSYSHYFFNAPRIPVPLYINDFYRCDSLIQPFTNYTKLYRYPYLKEGERTGKRDSMRAVLLEAGYKNGYVTVDASDWYIDGRMVDSLRSDLNRDLTPFKEYYLGHVLERAHYYDSLASAAGLTGITHTLLLHHNLLSALFLDDLIVALKNNGWQVVDAWEAYNDENYIRYVSGVMPAGESIVWSFAKEHCNECALRYPAEDGRYEEPKLTTKLIGNR